MFRVQFQLYIAPLGNNVVKEPYCLSVFFLNPRDSVNEEAFSGLLKVLSRLCDDMQAVSTEDAGLQLQMIAECFRAQRNACVQSTHNQNVMRYFQIQPSVKEKDIRPLYDGLHTKIASLKNLTFFLNTLYYCNIIALGIIQHYVFVLLCLPCFCLGSLVSLISLLKS